MIVAAGEQLLSQVCSQLTDLQTFTPTISVTSPLHRVPSVLAARPSAQLQANIMNITMAIKPCVTCSRLGEFRLLATVPENVYNNRS